MSWRSQREAALHRDQDPVPAPPLAPAPTPVQILALALALAQCPGPDLVLGPCPPPLRLLLAAPVLEAEALLLAKEVLLKELGEVGLHHHNLKRFLHLQGKLHQFASLLFCTLTL